MNIGRMIKDAREQQGLSMNALARMSGVPQSSISEVESGRRQPSIESVERIVNALGFDFADFFSSEKPALSPESQRLLKAVENLSKNELLKLTEFLEATQKEL